MNRAREEKNETFFESDDDRASPYATTVDRDEPRTRFTPGVCWQCGVRDWTFQCPGCAGYGYCSDKCQSAHWKTGGHRALCGEKTLAKRVEEDFKGAMDAYKTTHDPTHLLAFNATAEKRREELLCAAETIVRDAETMLRAMPRQPGDDDDDGSGKTLGDHAGDRVAEMRARLRAAVADQDGVLEKLVAAHEAQAATTGVMGCLGVASADMHARAFERATETGTFATLFRSGAPDELMSPYDDPMFAPDTPFEPFAVVMHQALHTLVTNLERMRGGEAVLSAVERMRATTDSDDEGSAAAVAAAADGRATPSLTFDPIFDAPNLGMPVISRSNTAQAYIRQYKRRSFDTRRDAKAYADEEAKNEELRVKQITDTANVNLIDEAIWYDVATLNQWSNDGIVNGLSTIENRVDDLTYRLLTYSLKFLLQKKIGQGSSDERNIVLDELTIIMAQMEHAPGNEQPVDKLERVVRNAARFEGALHPALRMLRLFLIKFARHMGIIALHVFPLLPLFTGNSDSAYFCWGVQKAIGLAIVARPFYFPDLFRIIDLKRVFGPTSIGKIKDLVSACASQTEELVVTRFDSLLNTIDAYAKSATPLFPTYFIKDSTGMVADVLRDPASACAFAEKFSSNALFNQDPANSMSSSLASWLSGATEMIPAPVIPEPTSWWSGTTGTIPAPAVAVASVAGPAVATASVAGSAVAVASVAGRIAFYLTALTSEYHYDGLIALAAYGVADNPLTSAGSLGMTALMWRTTLNYIKFQACLATAMRFLPTIANQRAVFGKTFLAHRRVDPNARTFDNIVTSFVAYDEFRPLTPAHYIASGICALFGKTALFPQNRLVRWVMPVDTASFKNVLRTIMSQDQSIEIGINWAVSVWMLWEVASQLPSVCSSMFQQKWDNSSYGELLTGFSSIMGWAWTVQFAGDALFVNSTKNIVRVVLCSVAGYVAKWLTTALYVGVTRKTSALQSLKASDFSPWQLTFGRTIYITLGMMTMLYAAMQILPAPMFFGASNAAATATFGRLATPMMKRRALSAAAATLRAHADTNPFAF